MIAWDSLSGLKSQVFSISLNHSGLSQSFINWFLMYSVIFRNVLVLCYTRGICSRNIHRDKYIRHLLTSSQGSIHIDPLLLVMGVYAKCICSNVPIPFLVESYSW